MFAFWRRLERKAILQRDFPEEYRAIISDNVPLYRKMSRPDQHKLESLVKILIAEKRLTGVQGLELDERMCITIAARACLLVLHRITLDDPLYPGLESVVVYPHSYRAQVSRQEGYVVHEGIEQRLGESWQRGTVVLSWSAVQHGSAVPHDGHDVVLHEFAHQLDAQNGLMNGTPELSSSRHYAAWARTFSHEFEALRSKIEEHHRTDIDPYAATNPAEFFAVVSEEFFETPDALLARHPELYRALMDYYRLDPAALLAEH